MSTTSSVGNIFGLLGKNAAQATTSMTNGAIKASNIISDLATTTTSTLTNTTTKALNSTGNSLGKAFNAVANATTSTLDAFAPAVNSLLPLNSNTGRNSNALFTNINATTTLATKRPWWVWAIGIFVVLVGILIGVFFAFREQIELGYKNIVTEIRRALGMETETPTPPPMLESDATQAVPDEADKIAEQKTEQKSLIEKILPMGGNEVFNVSQNAYSYYEAEPLCRALGAELATYDQVKEAWDRGADWCNYGWVKGQVAVFPTQKETWDKLQNGPTDERYACGKPGVNGGYFDNPEMKFGVTCYGKKPESSAADERILMEKGNIPKTPATLKVDQQVQEFKERLDELGILPFNTGKWSQG